MDKLSCSISKFFLPNLSDCHYTCTDCERHAPMIKDICNNNDEINCEECDDFLRSSDGNLRELYVSSIHVDGYVYHHIFHGKKYNDIDYNGYKHYCLACFNVSFVLSTPSE